MHIFAWETCAIIKEHVTGVYELQIKESLVEANSELYGHFCKCYNCLLMLFLYLLTREIVVEVS